MYRVINHSTMIRAVVGVTYLFVIYFCLGYLGRGRGDLLACYLLLFGLGSGIGDLLARHLFS